VGWHARRAVSQSLSALGVKYPLPAARVGVEGLSLCERDTLVTIEYAVTGLRGGLRGGEDGGDDGGDDGGGGNGGEEGDEEFPFASMGGTSVTADIDDIVAAARRRGASVGRIRIGLLPSGGRPLQHSSSDGEPSVSGVVGGGGGGGWYERGGCGRGGGGGGAVYSRIDELSLRRACVHRRGRGRRGPPVLAPPPFARTTGASG
jgi:hypothetical protein